MLKFRAKDHPQGVMLETMSYKSEMTDKERTWYEWLQQSGKTECGTAHVILTNSSESDLINPPEEITASEFQDRHANHYGGSWGNW